MKPYCTFLFLTLCLFSAAQEPKELLAEQILDSSLKFSGGEARISRLQTVEETYLLTQPDKSTAIISQKRREGLTYVQSILSTSHVPQTTFFNGKRVSRVNGASVTHYKDLIAMEEIKLRTYTLVQFGYKALKYRMTRLPDQKFKNVDCYLVAAMADNGYMTMNFFDKSNFRLVMIEYPGGNKSVMIEYAFKDSILFNTHILNTTKGSDELQVLRLQTVELNKPVSDLWFNCPYDDKVKLPANIIKGKFESTNGPQTLLLRTETEQDYPDENGKVTLRRFLKWKSEDTFGLIQENSAHNNSNSEILVRIISWDKKGYVCHWITGKYTDTQDYKIRKE